MDFKRESQPKAGRPVTAPSTHGGIGSDLSQVPPAPNGGPVLPPPPADRASELVGKDFLYPCKGFGGEQLMVQVTVTDYHGFVKNREGDLWEKVSLRFNHGVNEITGGGGNAALLQPIPEPEVRGGFDPRFLGGTARMQGYEAVATVRQISADRQRVTLEFDTPQPIEAGLPGNPTATVFETHWKRVAPISLPPSPEVFRGLSLGGTAFGITMDDVLAVMERNGARTNHETAMGLVQDAIPRIEKAALDGGTDMEEQTEAALQEIELVLGEVGFFGLNGPNHAWRIPEPLPGNAINDGPPILQDSRLKQWQAGSRHAGELLEKLGWEYDSSSFWARAPEEQKAKAHGWVELLPEGASREGFWWRLGRQGNGTEQKGRG